MHLTIQMHLRDASEWFVTKESKEENGLQDHRGGVECHIQEKP